MLQYFLIWIVLLLTGVHGNHHYDEPETVGDGDAPWVASVMRREGGAWQHVCVGALVKPRKVLTSAQCMDAWHNVTHPNHEYRVALGGADRSTGQVVAVNRSVQHTKYSAKNINVPDDIAVLTLASDAVLSNTVSVIPLRFDYNPKTNDECELYAWPHDAGSEIAQMATEVDSMMPLISTLPSHFHKKAKVAQDMTSHFHKKAKVAVMTSDRQFRTRRSTRGMGRRSHTRFTTQKGPFPPEIRMRNRSRSVVRPPVSPLQSGVDCHIRFRQFPGHTACLDAQPGVSAVDIDDELKERIVDMHNIYRASVSPPATNMLRMRWDEELAMLAARWAGTCPDDHDTLNFLPGRFGVGQNLFWAWDYKGDEIPIDVDWAIDEWFIERDDYDFNKPHWDQTMDWDKPTGHYTQMVWAGSYLVGCAVAYCGPDKSEYVVVCNYGPQGNMMGQPQPYEAGTACSDCKECVDGGLCDCGDKECGFGTLNTLTCKCEDCPSHGDHYTQTQDCVLSCTVDGTDKSPCGTKKNWKYEDCDKWYQARDCPYLCNVCPYSDPSYTQGNNEEGNEGGNNGDNDGVNNGDNDDGDNEDNDGGNNGDIDGGNNGDNDGGNDGGNGEGNDGGNGGGNGEGNDGGDIGGNGEGDGAGDGGGEDDGDDGNGGEGGAGAGSVTSDLSSVGLEDLQALVDAAVGGMDAAAQDMRGAAQGMRGAMETMQDATSAMQTATTNNTDGGGGGGDAGGGGTGGGSGVNQNLLHKLTRTVRENQHCAKYWKILSSKRKMSSKQMCVQNYPQKPHSTPVCKDARGAPLVCIKKNEIYLAGLLSFSDTTCQHFFPDVLTKISSYKHFLQDHLKD